MKLPFSSLSKKHKGMLPMKAKDLFEDDILNVYSKKTGEYLGHIRVGEEIDFNEEEEIQLPPIEEENKDQLKLF